MSEAGATPLPTPISPSLASRKRQCFSGGHQHLAASTLSKNPATRAKGGKLQESTSCITLSTDCLEVCTTTLGRKPLRDPLTTHNERRLQPETQSGTHVVHSDINTLTQVSTVRPPKFQPHRARRRCPPHVPGKACRTPRYRQPAGTPRFPR